MKDRYQNPVIGDTVKLRLFVLNSNNTAALSQIQKVEMYYLDPSARTLSNPDGRTLVSTIAGGSVTNPNQGEYEYDLLLDPLVFLTTGNYIDLWYVKFGASDPFTTLTQYFVVYPDLWTTTPIPIVYDFDFGFQPHKFRYGEKKNIEIEIIPNVPRATDLEKYYQNLAISADLSVSIGSNCGECQPTDECLPSGDDLIVDNAVTNYREKNRAFYFIDTTLFSPGIFNIWFTLNFGGSTYMSDNFQIQIWQ